MAEEAKQQGKSEGVSKVLRTMLMIVVGIAFLALGGYFLYRGWGYVIALVKGTIGLFCILVGVIFLAMAKD
ncbi:MAG: hypothetical protein PHT59_06215 [Candidatus Omnitrophica bacterium]|nr:hypothetical protein [Candidatus Omnitrophota bacterium]